ncbi:response regulator transcription factor, partial [Enterobacter hormaechei]
TPVLMLSALSDVDERVRGLRAGGDDYLTKPFASDEMAARVEVLLRRRQQPASNETVLRVGDLQLDLLARTAHRGGR